MTKANGALAAVSVIVMLTHCDSVIGDKGDDASVSNNESVCSGSLVLVKLIIHIRNML